MTRDSFSNRAQFEEWARRNALTPRVDGSPTSDEPLVVPTRPHSGPVTAYPRTQVVSFSPRSLIDQFVKHVRHLLDELVEAGIHLQPPTLADGHVIDGMAVKGPHGTSDVDLDSVWLVRGATLILSVHTPRGRPRNGESSTENSDR